ncbi:hypothetical protein [Rhodococcus sp. IEGM 1379]|uniref:hypothetical protein n=1 Tax=Rhodococcus sp. IEGM 1379 TaxID=3047086 RepID=UPI0024B6DCFF|nr:hypothetical protein [Rhodococcus sp. IEGM 1379]MDI9918775.1 hypothetical protein [Rhodococcus sp. IEGM 1379]
MAIIASLSVGTILLSTLRVDSPYVVIFLATPIIGLGIMSQNLVLVVQNAANVLEIGAANSAAAFFHSLGGALAVAVLGAVLGALLSTRVDTEIDNGLQESDIARSASGLTDGTLPDLHTLPDAVRNIVESAYGQGIGEVFLIAVPFAVIALICVIFIPNAVLGNKSGIEQLADIGQDESIEAPTAVKVS